MKKANRDCVSTASSKSQSIREICGQTLLNFELKRQYWAMRPYNGLERDAPDSFRRLSDRRSGREGEFDDSGGLGKLGSGEFEARRADAVVAEFTASG